jgi:biotin operon repressor
MAVRKTAIVNRDYDPSDHDEQVIQVLKDGRANPLHIREETGLSKQRVNDALDRLRSAGWVVKVTRGLYELVDDPRDDAEE